MQNKTPTKAQWQDLYAAADKIKQLKPWEYLWDMDIITLLIQSEEEPIFCSIMGMDERCYGINIYKGYKQLAGFFRAMESVNSPFYITMNYQNCLTCFFGNREELNKTDLTPIRELDLKFRGKNQWPYFRVKETGFIPWQINSQEAELIIKTLENLIIPLKTMLAEKIEVDFVGGETLIYQYNQDKQEYSTFVAPLPPIPMVNNHLIIKDELLIARLKKHNKSCTNIELALFYIPYPAKDKNYKKPKYPRMCIMADHDNGEIIDQYMLKSADLIPDILFGMLLNFINEIGIPKEINVRDNMTEAYLSDFCIKLDIKLSININLPAIGALESGLLNYMENR